MDTIGYTEHVLLSTPLFDFAHPDDRETTIKAIDMAFGGKATIQFTNRFRCGDGSYKWLEWKVTGGGVDKRLLLGAVRNVTERTQLEIELRRAKELAEAATKLKDKFVEMVAHDLKSPFISMLGLLKLVVERIPSIKDKENQIMLDRVFKSGDRMIATIDDLLNISRFQTGKIMLQPGFFKAYRAASVTVASLSHNATQKGIEIINELPVDMRLYADPSLFDEVLLNLLSNAIKFCSRGDKITIFVPPGLNSAIAVRDTGTGINERCALNLFKHEVKTNATGTAGELGTGLGLPFCHDIMTAHGGDITVESAPGKGSVFCAILPHVKPIALIVDDDELALGVLKEHLDGIGIDVVCASNGETALAALKDKRPHIIITDVNMPVMSGFALLSLLKKDSATKEIPVIVITASDREAREKALMLGADDFVGKPVAMDELIPRVRRFTA